MLLMVKTSNRVKKMLVVLMSTERCLLLMLLVDDQKKASSMLRDERWHTKMGRISVVVTSCNWLLHIWIANDIHNLHGVFPLWLSFYVHSSAW